MKPPLRPIDEAQRLDALRRYRLLDTLPEQALDDLTTLAAHICEAPISLISLVDDDRQWFKSKFGWAISETPRDVSFCGHVINQAELFLVPDAAEDERFADNPLVTGDPRVRFYAGAPLVTPEGQALGTLCVMDCVPRRLTPAQQDALRVLSRQVMAQLELRRQTRELVDSETRLFQVFRNCPVGVAIHRWSDATFVDVNAAFTNLLGWTHEEVIGHTTPALNIISADAAADIRSQLEASHMVREGELEVRTRAGDLRHVLMGAVRVELRKEPHTISTFVDITERSRAEEAVRASEARYRTLFECAPDGIVIADAQSYYVDANPTMCRMLGYARDEFIGLHASDIVTPVEVQHIGPALNVITEGSDYHREWQFLRKDGSTFAADVFATAMADGNLLGMVRDVTERNRASEALRTAEARMRFALQSADVGIWDMDYTTGLLQWSEILEAQNGLAPRTFGGTIEAFAERIHPDDRELVFATLGKAMKAGRDFSMTHRSVWPDGTVRWLSGAGRIHLGASGEPARGVGVYMDITERRLLEEQFQQAQKMEAIGRLAGGVAHDFNNLLTVILGYCELLLANLDSGDSRQVDITEIQKAGARGAGLTRQLLAFSRKEIIEPKRLDLNAVVADMRAMLGRLIGEDIKVVVRLRPKLAPVVADRGQIEQILMNLAVNARDAMPHGGTLTIETAHVTLDEQYARTHAEAAAGPSVTLTVTDTGTGMTPEVQARLFEPFFTTKELGKGTGLGLATVQGIMVRSGGSVSFESEVGRGTSFTAYFPQTDVAEVAVHAPPPAPVRPRAGTQTVLVVEDADGLRELTRRLLERLGFTVLVAANADEALGVFEGNASIDVLLTDVVMPGGSGPELTRRLIERRPALRVIYMSGYTEDAIVHHGVLNPGIAFLHKPFTSATLGRKIREVLNQ